MSGGVRLAIGLSLALACAGALAGGRHAVALLAWAPCAVSALCGRWFNRYALRPGRPPLLALAGQLARVALLAGLLVIAEAWTGPDYRAFASAGLGAFAVLMVDEVVDLALRSRTGARAQQGWQGRGYGG